MKRKVIESILNKGSARDSVLGEEGAEKAKSTKRGSCAKCGSENIDYGASELEGEDMYYPYDCKDCNSSGKEWYHLDYIETEEN